MVLPVSQLRTCGRGRSCASLCLRFLRCQMRGTAVSASRKPNDTIFQMLTAPSLYRLRAEKGWWLRVTFPSSQPVPDRTSPTRLLSPSQDVSKDTQLLLRLFLSCLCLVPTPNPLHPIKITWEGGEGQRKRLADHAKASGRFFRLPWLLIFPCWSETG